MKSFVTLGDLIADLYLGIESLPVQAAHHQTVTQFDLGPGGAGNALVAAARRVCYVTRTLEGSPGIEIVVE